MDHEAGAGRSPRKSASERWQHDPHSDARRGRPDLGRTEDSTNHGCDLPGRGQTREPLAEERPTIVADCSKGGITLAVQSIRYEA